MTAVACPVESCKGTRPQPTSQILSDGGFHDAIDSAAGICGGVLTLLPKHAVQLDMRPSASNDIADMLDPLRSSVQDGIVQMTKPRTIPPLRLSLLLAFAFLGVILSFARAQDSPGPSPKPQTSNVPTRLTIEVTGGDNNVPVENASVYVKYVEERKLRKDKKLELSVKTNREGIAHVPDANLGKALVQVVAEGWKSYGRWFDVTDPRQIIKVHLERPPKWY